jgi:hypothetical protein
MKKITFSIIMLFSIISISFAQVSATGSYTAIGDVVITNVTNDADNGDGENDGAKYIDGQSSVVGQGISFTFDGVMEQGSSYQINTTIYNPNGSFCGVDVSLFNKTDNIQVGTLENADLFGSGDATGRDIAVISITYTAIATDVGDVLELRYVRDDDGNVARNFAIDVLTLNNIAVGPTPTNFLSDGSWAQIGNTNLTNTTDDADNGDGVNDGAIYIDGQVAEVGQGAIYTFTQTITAGDDIDITTSVYNSGASFCGLSVFLYNATDNTQLGTAADLNLFGKGDATGRDVSSVSIGYTAIASDTGDILELRFVRDDDGNVVRNFSIDNANINNNVISTDLSELSIEDAFLRDNISVYPNPTKSFINIELSNNISIEKITLIDLTGKVILNNNFTNKLDVSSLPRGLYLLKIQSDKGNVTTKKVILN